MRNNRHICVVVLIGCLAACAIGADEDDRNDSAADTRGKTTERGEAKSEAPKRQPPRTVRVARAAGQYQYDVKDPQEFVKPSEKPVFSGPQAGEKLPALKVTGVRDPLDGKEFDPVKLAEGKPQILVFQDENGSGLRGLLGFSRVVDTLRQQSKQDIQFATVFLGDDPQKMASFGKKLDRFASDDWLMGVSEEGRDGPGAYGLDRNISTTILVAKNGEVLHNFTFPQAMPTPDPYVLGALAELLGKDRDAVKSWLTEAGNAKRMRMKEAMQERAKMQSERAPSARGAKETSTPAAQLRKRLNSLVETGKLTREEADGLLRVAFPESAGR